MNKARNSRNIIKATAFLGIAALVFAVGNLIYGEMTREERILLTPIECYLGRTLVHKGVIRGNYHGNLGRQGRGQIWRFTDHRTGKIVTFGGFCTIGYGTYLPASAVAKGAMPKNQEVW